MTKDLTTGLLWNFEDRLAEIQHHGGPDEMRRRLADVVVYLRKRKLRRIPTETVSTHELQVGDLVSCHGAIFRLVKRNEEKRPSRHGKYEPKYDLVVWFNTELVCEGMFCVIPKHWVNDWHIQGNGIAYWTRLKRDRITEYINDYFNK